MTNTISSKNIAGFCAGFAFSLLLIYFLEIPYLQEVSYECSTQVTTAFFVIFLMLFLSLIRYKLSAISFIQPPFPRHVAQSSTEATRLRKKEVDFL